MDKEDGEVLLKKQVNIANSDSKLVVSLFFRTIFLCLIHDPNTV